MQAQEERNKHLLEGDKVSRAHQTRKVAVATVENMTQTSFSGYVHTAPFFKDVIPKYTREGNTCTSLRYCAFTKEHMHL